MTMMNAGINGNGMMSNISWIWIPAMVALLLSVLLGWAIFWKKE
jgi:high-affinity Fe2+/Pb2+ permease